VKITNNFCYEWKPTTKLTLFAVSKDKWDTKEGTGKFTKNALHVQWHGKMYLSRWSNIEQLAIVELRKSEGTRQLVENFIN